MKAIFKYALSVVLLVFASGVLIGLLSPTLTISPAWPGPAAAFAPRDYISDLQFTTVDILSTEQAKREAADKALPVYSFDGEALRNALLNTGTFLEIFDEFRQKPTLTFEEKMNVLRLKNVVKKSDGPESDRIPHNI